MTKPITDERKFLEGEAARAEGQMKEWKARAFKAEDEIDRLREKLKDCQKELRRVTKCWEEK